MWGTSKQMKTDRSRTSSPGYPFPTTILHSVKTTRRYGPHRFIPLSFIYPAPFSHGKLLSKGVLSSYGDQPESQEDEFDLSGSLIVNYYVTWPLSGGLIPNSPRGFIPGL